MWSARFVKESYKTVFKLLKLNFGTAAKRLVFFNSSSWLQKLSGELTGFFSFHYTMRTIITTVKTSHTVIRLYTGTSSCGRHKEPRTRSECLTCASRYPIILKCYPIDTLLNPQNETFLMSTSNTGFRKVVNKFYHL